MNIRTIGRLLPGIILPAALGLFLLLLAGWTRPGHGPSTIIISEVAWGGTAANSADEWLELHNPGPTPIDLTGWHLQDGDGGLDILLNGSIPAGGFFLLERSDDNTISDIPADQIYTGSLSNSGETLTLRDTADQVIDTANNDGGGWPAGSGSPNYLSMERLGPTLPDSDTNWVGNNTVIRNGLDANGNPINGTPSQPNAAWQSSSTGDVLLDAVLYDGYTSGDSDEAIQLRNMIPNTITLAGWQLSDGTTTALFPAGAQLPLRHRLGHRRRRRLPATIRPPTRHHPGQLARLRQQRRRSYPAQQRQHPHRRPHLQSRRHRPTRLERPRPGTLPRQRRLRRRRADTLPPAQPPHRPDCARHRHRRRLGPNARRRHQRPQSALSRLGPRPLLLHRPHHPNRQPHRRHRPRQRLPGRRQPDQQRPRQPAHRNPHLRKRRPRPGPGRRRRPRRGHYRLTRRQPGRGTTRPGTLGLPDHRNRRRRMLVHDQRRRPQHPRPLPLPARQIHPHRRPARPHQQRKP